MDWEILARVPSPARGVAASSFAVTDAHPERDVADAPG
jgi:hypothetical protein